MQNIVKILQGTEPQHAERSTHWDKDTQKRMSGKNLVAFEVLLKKYPEEFFDETLISEMYQGFSLVGLEPYKHAFDYEPLLPSSTVSQLSGNSHMNNASLLNRTKSSGQPDVDQKLREMAMEERDQGWLIGPFEKLQELLPHTNNVQPNISRRFPLVQGEKIRPIENYAETTRNPVS